MWLYCLANDALNVNPLAGDAHITTLRSDFYWATLSVSFYFDTEIFAVIVGFTTQSWVFELSITKVYFITYSGYCNDREHCIFSMASLVELRFEFNFGGSLFRR